MENIGRGGGLDLKGVNDEVNGMISGKMLWHHCNTSREVIQHVEIIDIK